MDKIKPNPGSDEAIDQGCKCPVMDNEHGKGYMGIHDIFVYSELCPLHNEEFKKGVLESSDKKKRLANKKKPAEKKKVKSNNYWCNFCHLNFSIKVYIESQVYVNYGIEYCPACGKPLCGYYDDDI